MKYLFCTEITYDRRGGTPDGTQLQTAALPQTLRDALRDQQDTVLKAAGASELPGWLRAARRVFLFIGICIACGILRATVTIEQAYQRGPAFFWIGGISLVLAGILTLIEKWKQRNAGDQTLLKSAVQGMERLSAQADACLGVPADAFRTDVLQFAYHTKHSELRIEDPVELPEMRLFREGAALQLSDGERLYTLPLGAITALRLVEQPVMLFDWNKPESPTQERFRRGGVVVENGEIAGLRFFCALELSLGGEAYSLLVPGYELPVIEALTGLRGLALPAESTQKGRQSDGLSGELRPVFYWHPPKDRLAFWFTRQADDEFKAAHPTAHEVLMLIGFMLLLGPAVLFFLAANSTFDINANYWVLLGCAGGFVFGVALFNIVAAWMHQYLGHVVTIVCILLGSAIMAVSWLLI